jgi:hypothetical protein
VKALFERVLPQETGGLQIEAGLSRDPVFNTTTVVLRVSCRDQPPVTAKASVASCEGTSHEAIEAAFRRCFTLLAPRLYEHDPRRGFIVTPRNPALQGNVLFDPPEHSPVVFDLRQYRCTVCEAPFSPTGWDSLAVWGGGNLGFLHFECCKAVNVRPLL